jgi:hypothetical protein
MRKTLMLLALVLGVAACKDSTGAKTYEVDGLWEGPISGVTMTLTLSESSHNVSGTGSLHGPGGSLPLSVSGTNAYPSITLTLSSPGYEPMTYQATMSGRSAMSGTLHGSGFTGESMTLTKQ